MKIFIYLLLLLTSSLAHCQVFEAEFISNNDGDTGIIIVKLPHLDRYCDYRLETIKFRLFQCDTYELNDNNFKKRTFAKRARKFTFLQLSKNSFFVKYRGKDIYGRWLITFYFQDGSTLKERLAKQGLLTGRYNFAKEGRDACR